MRTYFLHISEGLLYIAERTFENLALLFIGVIVGSYLYWGF